MKERPSARSKREGQARAHEEDSAHAEQVGEQEDAGANLGENQTRRITSMRRTS